MDERDRDLQARTKRFALRVIKVFTALKKNDLSLVLGRQMLRSGTSVGAHYREACRARSTAEFISKLEVGIQERSETGYWLELIVDSKILPEKSLRLLIDETEQLLAILVTSVRTAKKGR